MNKMRHTLLKIIFEKGYMLEKKYYDTHRANGFLNKRNYKFNNGSVL